MFAPSMHAYGTRRCDKYRACISIGIANPELIQTSLNEVRRVAPGLLILLIGWRACQIVWQLHVLTSMLREDEIS